MYTNESSEKSVRVYPNKDAIKQMTLKSSLSSIREQPPAISGNICQNENNLESISSNNAKPSCASSTDGDIFLLFFLLIMLCDSDSALFQVILALFYIN